jgi:hypothetical protein
MAIRKNKKRIDPRYFLHETTYRDEIDEGKETLAEWADDPVDLCDPKPPTICTKVKQVNDILAKIPSSTGGKTNMYIKLVSDSPAAGEGPVIDAIQLYSDGGTWYYSRWTKFSDFLELFRTLPKDEDIMAALEKAAPSR